MTMRGLGHRNLLTEASWVLLISLFGLSDRCIGQTYNGFSYSVSGTDIAITGYTGPAGAVTIPSSIPGVSGTVTSIGASAFQRIAGLTSLTIPSSVTDIGGGAFEGCESLTSLTIPSSVTDIGASAFQGCEGLTHITIPSGVTSIAYQAFEDCGLTSLVIPSSVTDISDGAFALCSGLTSLTIPSSVTDIGGGAFEGCESLTSLTFPSSVASIGYHAFWQCSGLARAYFQGDAPAAFGSMVFDGAAPNFSIYYPTNSTGWTTPSWNGYPAQPYDYTPPSPQPRLALTLGSGAVTPSFNNLQLGTNYQLQVSTDLSTWSNSGPVFTATNSSAAYPQPFNVSDWNHLFFRLVSAP